MDWTSQDTITIGALLGGIVSLLFLIVRMMGKRTDPALIDLSTKIVESQQSINLSVDRQTTSIDRQTETYANVFDKIAQLLQDSQSQQSVEHRALLTAIERLTQNITTQGASNIHGMEAMIKGQLAMLDHSEILQQIADKLDTLLRKIDTMRDEFVGRVEQVEKEVTKIKIDVMQVTQDMTAPDVPPAEPAAIPTTGTGAMVISLSLPDNSINNGEKKEDNHELRN